MDHRNRQRSSMDTTKFCLDAELYFPIVLKRRELYCIVNRPAMILLFVFIDYIFKPPFSETTTFCAEHKEYT